MTGAPAPWQDVATRLRPFIARRVAPSEIDDVMQDVFIRMQRGLPALREDERFIAWLFQIARSSVAEHMRVRARHPLADDAAGHDPPAEPSDDNRDAAHLLVSCVASFVARLESPYREAITLVELDGLTARAAAEQVGISVSGMKSRVQRGRSQLRKLFEDCCEIALDVRGRVTDVSPRANPCRSCK